MKPKFPDLGTGAAHSSTNLTTKQQKLLSVIVAGDGKDYHGNMIPVDMDQILERLDYETTKQSLQFSIRALAGKKMAYKGDVREVRRGRARTVVFPTDLAKAILGAATCSQSFIEPMSEPTPQPVSEVIEK